MAATGTPTPNIGLRIPQGTDPASVDDINYNSNLLDTKLGAVGNTSVQDQIDSLNSKANTSSVTMTFASGVTNQASWCAKQGGIIVLNVAVYVTHTSGGQSWFKIADLPSNCYPNHGQLYPLFHSGSGGNGSYQAMINDAGIWIPDQTYNSTFCRGNVTWAIW